MAVSAELLQNLRLLLDEDGSTDLLLSYLLEIAASKILERCYPFDATQTTVPDRYLYKQVEIAQFLWNKRGAEGQTAHSENGISRTYEGGDVPESLLRGITPFVGAVVTVDEDA